MADLRNPAEAYRKVDLDARVEGSDPRELTIICLERVRDSLTHARIANRHGEQRARQDALATAHRVLLGLLRAIDAANPLADALDTVYRVALHRIERAMRDYDPNSLALVGDDMEDLLAGFSKV